MNILNALRSAGYRATRQRRSLLEELDGYNSVHIGRLRDLFLEKTGADTATFYRIIADFERSGLIHAVHEDGGEYVCLCNEVRHNRIPTSSYELTHCHGCGHVSDHHIQPLSASMLKSYHEAHVSDCDQCRPIRES